MVACLNIGEHFSERKTKTRLKRNDPHTIGRFGANSLKHAYLVSRNKNRVFESCHIRKQSMAQQAKANTDLKGRFQDDFYK
jgi:hypothetical protein